MCRRERSGKARTRTHACVERLDLFFPFAGLRMASLSFGEKWCDASLPFGVRHRGISVIFVLRRGFLAVEPKRIWIFEAFVRIISPFFGKKRIFLDKSEETDYNSFV